MANMIEDTGATLGDRRATPGQFEKIAPWYDALMADVPYDMWLRYVLSLVEIHGSSRSMRAPVRVLDLGCGTGTMTFRFERHGCSVVGVDVSEPMIAVARRRAADRQSRAVFHVQDAATLELPGLEFDLCVSLFDSLNYILTPERLSAAMNGVARLLSDGGLFVFDVNTVYALRKRLFDQVNLRPASAVRYRWRSRYDPVSRLCIVTMEFWTGQPGKDEESFVEVHTQRGYELDEIELMLKQAGFGQVSMYQAYTYDPCTETTDRAFFVASMDRSPV